MESLAAHPPLSVNNVTKQYDKTPVLQDVSFTLEAGEIFGLIGLNGAGKTTLIKIILSMARADNGMATLFGKPAKQVEARKQLVYLPEKFQPSKYLKGMEYLSLSLAYYGKSLDKDKAKEMAENLGLPPEVLSKRISGYSKGMGQKLGLISAFLLERPLLILDEPMSGLDPLARIQLKKQMLKYKEAGNTLFFSSHILADMDEICDRIGMIHDHELKFIGKPSEFKNNSKENSLEQAFLNMIAI
jgi:ABC-2 type transport system ATP-binding protein